MTDDPRGTFRIGPFVVRRSLDAHAVLDALLRALLGDALYMVRRTPDDVYLRHLDRSAHRDGDSARLEVELGGRRYRIAIEDAVDAELRTWDGQTTLGDSPEVLERLVRIAALDATEER